MRKNPVHVRFGKPITPPAADDPHALQAFVKEGQDAVERMQVGMQPTLRRQISAGHRPVRGPL